MWSESMGFHINISLFFSSDKIQTKHNKYANSDMRWPHGICREAHCTVCLWAWYQWNSSVTSHSMVWNRCWQDHWHCIMTSFQIPLWMSLSSFFSNLGPYIGEIVRFVLLWMAANMIFVEFSLTKGKVNILLLK